MPKSPPRSGGNLAAGAAGTAIIDLIDPNTQYEKRLYQVDLRVAKNFGIRRARVKGMLDLYNLFNASPVLLLNTATGRNGSDRPTFCPAAWSNSALG